MSMNVSYLRSDDRLVTAIRLLKLPEKERIELVEEYRKRSDAAFAETTKRVFRQVIRSFGRWCVEHGYNSEPPISPSVVASYVDSLAGKIRPNTIETRLWAIGEMHKSYFLPSPSNHRLVVLALKAVKRMHGCAERQAPPLMKREVLDAIDRMGDSRIDLRDKALLWTATDSWCRSSELTSFLVEDIKLNVDGSAALYIRRSKTDPLGRGAYAYLSPEGARAVERWITVAELQPTEPVFTKSQRGGKRTPLDPATVSRIFKRRTGRQDVSAHSTRVGGVHDALNIGCGLTSIMVAGRWNSPEMPAQYGKRILVTNSAAAQVAAAFRREELP